MQTSYVPLSCETKLYHYFSISIFLNISGRSIISGMRRRPSEERVPIIFFAERRYARQSAKA